MPLTKNTPKLNYMQLAYKGEGAPQDLIMVHGLAANMAFWLEVYAKYFSKYFRVTIYDLAGHGRSATPQSGYRPEDMANQLQNLTDELGIKKAHFLVHSFGGVVALNLACKNPDLFSSLAIADTHISIGRALGKEQKWETGEIIASLLKENGIELDTKHPYFGYHMLTEIARLRCEDKPIPEKLMPWTKWIFGEVNKRTAQKWLDLMDKTKAANELLSNDGLTREKLSKLQFPILAMYGEKSQSMATGNFLKNTLPNAQFEVIKNGGHFFPRANPEEVTSLCEEFYNNINLSSSGKKLESFLT